MAERLPAPLAEWLAGETSGPLALMHLLMAAGSVEAAEAELRDPRFADLARLLDENRDGAGQVIGMLRAFDHGAAPASPEAAIAAVRRSYDKAVAAAPPVSVAAYALGNESILAEATAELTALLRRWGLLSRKPRVLDIGCGIGRVAAALSGEVASVTGVDVSAGMVAEARRRCAGLANVTLDICSGRDLAPFPDRSFDLALAVDSFPYVVQAGPPLVEAHFREVARVLAPGGDFLILNFSYRGDPEADRADAAAMAQRFGFDLLRAGARELKLWDGRAFHFRRR